MGFKAYPEKTIAGTNVSVDEISYLDGVTSNIQTQINTIFDNAPTITNPTFNVSLSGGENYTSVDEIINPAISGSFKISNYSAIPPFSVGDIVTFINSPRNDATIDGMNFEVVDSGFDNVFETYFVRVAAVNTSDNSTVDTWVGFGGGAPSGFSMSTVSSKTITPANIGHLDDPTFLITDTPKAIAISDFGTSSNTITFYGAGPSLTTLQDGILAAGNKFFLTNTSSNNVDIDYVEFTATNFNQINAQYQMHVTVSPSDSADNAKWQAYIGQGGQGSSVFAPAATVQITPSNILKLKSLSATAFTSQDVNNTPSIGNLVSGKYFIDTSAYSTQVKLPAAPELGTEIQIFDAGGVAGTNNITVVTASYDDKINGQNDSGLLDTNGVAATFIWTGATYGWRMG